MKDAKESTIVKDAKERFTAWLTIPERNHLRDDALEFGTSENYVLRMIIREHYRMGAPRTAARNTADNAERE